MRRDSHVLGEPLYIVTDDAKDYFPQLGYAPEELHKFNTVFLRSAVELKSFTSKGVTRGWKEVWEGTLPDDSLTVQDAVYHGFVRVRCWNLAN